MEEANKEKAKQLYKSTTHEERFMHIHFPNLNASITQRFIGATVFARKEDDGVWYGAVALCSSRDQFSRKAGRVNARRRYFALQFMQELARSEKIDFKKLRDGILHMRDGVNEYDLELFLQHEPDAFKKLLA